MKIKIAIIISLFIILMGSAVLAYNPTVERKGINAIGFSMGAISGSGLSTQYYINDNNVIQFTGRVHLDSNDFTYNFGLMYKRILHEGERTKFYYTPGISLTNDAVFRDRKNLFYTGLSYGIEFKVFEQIGLNLLYGFGGSLEWSDSYPNSNYKLGPTAGIGLFYFFN